MSLHYSATEFPATRRMTQQKSFCCYDDNSLHFGLSPLAFCTLLLPRNVPLWRSMGGGGEVYLSLSFIPPFYPSSITVFFQISAYALITALLYIRILPKAIKSRRFTVISFHGEIVQSQIFPLNSQIVPQNS